MILVVYFATLFAILIPALRVFPETPKAVVSLLLSNLIFSSLVLGSLVRLLDRPGPVRDWIVALSFSLLFPCFAILFTIEKFDFGPPIGRSLPTMILILIWDLCVALDVFFHGVPALRPARCPACGRRSLIPRKNARGRIPPVAEQIRWCASCGSEYRRRPSGGWEDAGASPTRSGGEDDDGDQAEPIAAASL
jgi:hypothetical protein